MVPHFLSSSLSVSVSSTSSPPRTAQAESDVDKGLAPKVVGARDGGDNGHAGLAGKLAVPVVLVALAVLEGVRPDGHVQASALNGVGAHNVVAAVGGVVDDRVGDKRLGQLALLADACVKVEHVVLLLLEQLNHVVARTRSGGRLAREKVR